MRLICPNCGAQYEVADDVIPVAGRDVQCSNCGHTWFERPGASEAAEAGEPLPMPGVRPAPTVPEVPQPDPEPDPEPLPEPVSDPEPEEEPEPEPEPVTFPDADPVPAYDPVPAFDPVAAAAAAAVPRRGLSEGLAEMLREEAAREAEARAAEAAARPQSAPAETSLSNDPDREEVRLRTARLRSEDPPKPVTPATRRDMLPDIEKINSSLRPATEYGSVDTTAEPVVQARKRGARFGFSTVMLIVAILVGLYVGAPKLSTLVPAAAPVLTRYVAVVNDARLWIDLKMQAFIADQSAPAAEPATQAPATDTPATDTPAAQTPSVDTVPVAPVAPVPPATDQSNG